MKDNNYERILAWLDGTMTSDERSIFENEMREDRQLAEEVELAKSVISAQKEKEVIAMRKQLTEIMESDPLPGKKGRGNGRRLILALLVLAGLALLFFMFSKEKKVPLPKRIGPIAAYEKYFSIPDESLELNIGDSQRTETDEDSVKNRIGQIASQLNKQLLSNDPIAALESLAALRNTDPENLFLSKNELLLFEGILRLQSGKAESAIFLFDEVEKFRPNEEAQWYRAGALLLLQRKKEAVSQLESIISQSAHPKKKDARELLRSLEN